LDDKMRQNNSHLMREIVLTHRLNDLGLFQFTMGVLDIFSMEGVISYLFS